jgi:hypothetical protein
VAEEVAVLAGLAHRLHQNLGGMADDPVAGLVPVLVVVGLEIVQIAIADGEVAAAREALLDLAVDGEVSRKPGQRVRARLLLRPPDHHLDSGLELERVHRLDDVVVGALPRPAILFCTWSWLVSMMMGMKEVAKSLFMTSQASKPFISSMLTSIRIRSGVSPLPAQMASLPFEAVVTS